MAITNYLSYVDKLNFWLPNHHKRNRLIFILCLLFAIIFYLLIFFIFIQKFDHKIYVMKQQRTVLLQECIMLNLVNKW